MSSVIVFESSKGGAGKTTSALLLALQLCKHSSVTIIDADPNRPIMRWGRGGNQPPNLHIVSDADENNIIERIEEGMAESQFVVVDLEGTSNKIVLLAVSLADFVVIPTQGSELDAAEASRGIAVIRQNEKISRRRINHAVLLTRTSSAIRTKNVGHIQQSLRAAGIPVFDTELNEREAFKSVFSFRNTLEGMDTSEVANLDKAKNNVEAFTHELLEKILQNKKTEVA